MEVRGRRVMLSDDLAKLYGVAPGALIQAVKRNRQRFPDDFLFQLTKEEFGNLKSQSVISSWGGMRRAFPYAFTEQGVAMLSSVLRSKKAIEVNISIMRAFVKLRELSALGKAVAAKLDELQRRVGGHDAEIAQIFEAIRSLTEPPAKPTKQIGF